MNIKFSRHCKRRIKLYSINEQDIISAIEKHLLESKINEGKLVLIKKPKLSNNYPLKIVFEKIKDEVIVITAYPLKKGK